MYVHVVLHFRFQSSIPLTSKIMYEFHLSSIRAACVARYKLFDFTFLNILDESIRIHGAVLN
jgi:hypothetical protein